MERKKPYRSGYGYDKKMYVDGQGDGLDYYSGEMCPELRFDTEQEAKKSAMIANIAFQEGYKAAQNDVKKILGL